MSDNINKPTTPRPRKKKVSLDSLSEEDKKALLEELMKDANVPEPTNTGRKCQFRKNKYKDDMSLCEEDREFTKKIKFQVSARTRKNNTIKGTCSKCNSKFDKSHVGEYLCPGCSTRK